MRSWLKWHQCMGQRSNIWQKFETFRDSGFCKVHMFWTHKLCSQSVRSLYLTVHCACPYAQTPDIQIFLVNLFQKTIIICKSSLIRSNGQNSSSILQFFVTPQHSNSFTDTGRLICFIPPFQSTQTCYISILISEPSL